MNADLTPHAAMALVRSMSRKRIYDLSDAIIETEMLEAEGKLSPKVAAKLYDAFNVALEVYA